MTTATGLYMGTRYDWQTLLRALGLAWFIVAIAAFLTGALNPSFGRVQEVHIGAWQGLYFEKNQLGGAMAIAATFAGFLAILDQAYRKVWIGFLGLAVLLVLLVSQSSPLKCPLHTAHRRHASHYDRSTRHKREHQSQA